MKSNEIAEYRGLTEVRNYGVLLLVALLFLNGAALGVLNWFETNEIRNELAVLSEGLPSSISTSSAQTISLPDDVLSFHVNSLERVGFYESTIAEEDYLAYANPKNNYILVKSEAAINHEVRNFAFALLALFIGEVVVLIGWWVFLRSKIRELFEV